MSFLMFHKIGVQRSKQILQGLPFLHQFFLHQFFFTPIFLHHFFAFFLHQFFLHHFFPKNLFLNFKIWCKKKLVLKKQKFWCKKNWCKKNWCKKYPPVYPSGFYILSIKWEGQRTQQIPVCWFFLSKINKKTLILI